MRQIAAGSRVFTQSNVTVKRDENVIVLDWLCGCFAV